MSSGIATQLGLFARVLRPIDIFVNTERIRSVSCPVVVVHGTADWVVPCSHGRTLPIHHMNVYEKVESHLIPWTEQTFSCKMTGLARSDGKAC